jgi:hypothetical protein
LAQKFSKSQKLRSRPAAQQQHPDIAMASVYKTVSGTEAHEKEVVEKRNKQRVLILVHMRRQQQNTPMLTGRRVPEVLPSATAICCRIFTR